MTEKRTEPSIPFLGWRPLIGVIGVIGVIASGGCGDGGRPDIVLDSVAGIDGEGIHTAEFEGYLLRTVGERVEDLSSEVLSELFDDFLDEKLLARLAVARGVASFDDPPRYSVDRLLETARLADPPRARIQAFYEAHRGEFARPERVRLRQVLVEERQEAERALQELSRGEDFEEVARRFSRDPSASFGGDQGELARAELPPAFAELIFQLSPGQVSEIVAADYGFHIFEVVERLPAEIVTLAAAEPEIRRRLLSEDGDRALERLVEEARNRYNVEVYAGILPFNYQGSYRDDKV